jgi:deoxyribodipyrimidine photo-lyase
MPSADDLGSGNQSPLSEAGRVTQPTIMWFRRDLRCSDNPALVEAARSGDPVVALFVVDPALWEPAGANRRSFLVGCLRALDADIDGALVVRHGNPVEVVAEVAAEVGAETVYVAEDFGPYGRARDERVEAALGRDGRRLQRIGSAYAVEPGRVRNQAGDPYKVFTPFSKAWRQIGWPDPIRRPTGTEWLRGLETEPFPEARSTTERLPVAGEEAARAALDRFVRHHVEHYAERRNRPGVEGTSRLSPYLKWGCIHPRQILARLGRTTGDDVFRSELAWREFYADVLFHRPSSARQSLREDMAGMHVDDGPETDEAFSAWAEGRTGFPLVDAGMRQLLIEGWMHNRVRMVAASFLVKDLHLDWTRGARHFMHHLVDADLASNQHGWQWVAGTGTDAAPYFRVFNPVAQSKRFDPEGTYIRQWVPELASLDGSTIHEPWRADRSLFGGASDYPSPMVDHAAERAEALARYEALKRR